jgi:hypothetical protein
MDPILLIQVIAAEAGLILYGASFFSYGWDEGGRFVIAALVCSFLASIPTVVRDRKFFLKHWGFGLLGVRRRFPFQFFPGRHVEWLNPLGWCFMGILLLHFFWFVMHSPITPAAQADTSADLRYVSLLATFGGVLSALSRAYPPTEKPQAEGRLRIDADVSSF